MAERLDECPMDPVAEPPIRGPISPPDIRCANGLTSDPYFVTRHPLAAARGIVSRRIGAPVPPGPRGLPGIGVWPEYTSDPYLSIQRWAAQHGDVFRVPLPLWDLVVVNHPDLAEEVLCDREGRYSFVGPFRRPIECSGAMVPVMEGERSTQRRRALMPMFSRRNLAKYANVIVEEMVTRIDAWERWADTGETIDLQHEIAQVTLAAFMRSMYSVSFSDEQNAQIDHDIRMLMAASTVTHLFAPPNVIPWPGADSVPASYVRLRRLVSGLIDERLANPIEGTDLLDVLLQAREPDGSPLPRKDLIHELIVLMGGGFDTVVAALSWTLGLLSRNPEPEALMHAEVRRLGGTPPTPEDLRALSWTKACFDEGQRLQGGPMFPRFADKDVELGGFPIRKGTMIGVGFHAMHRDPRWWPEPDRYDPTRFTDKAVIAARPKHAFLPFSAGTHNCIGSGMGYMNAQFMLAIISQRYRLETPAGWQPRHEFKLATTIKGGLPVTLRRRKDR